MNKDYGKAIVRQPGRSLVHGITSTDLGAPDYKKAKDQHAAYVDALRKCGLEVTILEPLEEYPDSVFIEDTALVTLECAIITNPGAKSRRGESRAMRSVLSAFYKNIEIVKDPGRVDAGDILNIDTHYYIGISARTNEMGAQQVIRFLEEYGMTASTVHIQNLLHLKSGVAYLGNDTLVVTGELQSEPQFQKYDMIKVGDEEKYAANCIRINDYVLMPAGFPVISKDIKARDFKTIELNVSEFQKLDGGISCLSLRF